MSTQDDRYGALTTELMAERARTLGRAGERLERALAALEKRGSDPAAREDAVWDAADAAFCYIVQREVMGIRDSEAALTFYRVPLEVRRLVGVRRPPRAG
jgi:hypothetical protein